MSTSLSVVLPSDQMPLPPGAVLPSKPTLVSVAMPSVSMRRPLQEWQRLIFCHLPHSFLYTEHAVRSDHSLVLDGSGLLIPSSVRDRRGNSGNRRAAGTTSRHTDGGWGARRLL